MPGKRSSLRVLLPLGIVAALAWAGACGASRPTGGASSAMGATSRGTVRITLTVMPRISLRTKLASLPAVRRRGRPSTRTEELCVDGNVAEGTYMLSQGSPPTVAGAVHGSGEIAASPSPCIVLADQSAGGGGESSRPQPGVDDASRTVTLLISAQ